MNNSACVSCESGKFAPTALTGSCIECDAGSHTNAITGATLCLACAAGKYSGAQSALNCTACYLGHYSTVGQKACLPCEPGTYSDRKGSSSCSQCDPGQFTENKSSVGCRPCASGRSQNYPGASECKPCIAGQYTNTNGSYTCTRCAAGSATSVTQARACMSCSPGQYQSGTGAIDCEFCPAGKYSAESATVVCSDCRDGLSSLQGSSSCTTAQPGRFLDPFSGRASMCPSGAVCVGGDEMPQPRRGFWVDRSELAFAGIIFKCPRDTCVGTENAGEAAPPVISSRRRHLASDSLVPRNVSCWNRMAYYNDSENLDCDADRLLCRYGSSGPLCSTCIDNYVYSNAHKVCQECRTSWVFAATVFSIGSVSLALYSALRTGRLILPSFFSRWWVVGTLRQIDSGTFRVLWSSYQIIQSCSWNLDVAFPPVFDALVGILSVFSFDFLSLECITESSNHFTTVLLWSIAPILLAACNGVVCVGRLAHLKRGQRKGGGRDESDGTSSRERLLRQHSYIFLMLTYLVLPPVSR